MKASYRLKPIPCALAAATVALLAAGCQSAPEADKAAKAAAMPTGPVTVYSSREEDQVAPLLQAFTQASGIEVKAVYLPRGKLMEQIKQEGAQSPADVYLAVDIDSLDKLVQAQATQPVQSKVLTDTVPAALRDAGGHWFAVSQRDRVLYADKKLGLKQFTYEELADPKWKGKVCIRSGANAYNTGLIAAMIAHNGEAKTEAWLKGVKANLARKPEGGDRDVARDIMKGVCQIGIGNYYYVGRMRAAAAGSEQRQWADAIDVVRPSFANGAGTQVNVSGIALARHAPHPEAARRLMEYWVSVPAQQWQANHNFEHPVNAKAQPDSFAVTLGALKPDHAGLQKINQHRKQAAALVEKVQFDK